MGCVFSGATFLFVFVRELMNSARNAVSNVLNYKMKNHNNTENNKTRKIMESTNTFSWS